MTAIARQRARDLLCEVGAADAPEPEPPDESPAAANARSGVVALTGSVDGPPRATSAPLASFAEAALAAFRALAGPTANPELARVNGAELLGERAACAELQRRGRVTPGGSGRLYQAADGWLAVNLARGPEDLRLLPAWLGCGSSGDAWELLAKELPSRQQEPLLERARWLGLAVASADRMGRPAGPWLRTLATGPPRSLSAAAEEPLVVDLSALWAGPLCGRLLRLAGARVIKVESSGRPDGARGGPARFFDLQNAGKQSVALDFNHNAGRSALKALLRRADIVLESSRPRALSQLGIDAESWVEERPGRIWVSITGYGRTAHQGMAVAFGDDAAAAAGLSWTVPKPPIFVGDAVADPLAGLHAAVAALACWRGGRGALLDVALRDVVALAVSVGDATQTPASLSVASEKQRFVLREGDSSYPIRPPRAAQPRRAAQPLGADTRAVLSEISAAT